MSSPDPDIRTEIAQLFHERGGSNYGKEAVTQLQHALQAAWFAERKQAAPAVIIAALLHDVGHLLHDLPDDAPDRGVDDLHEDLGARWLRQHFSEEVAAPVEMHVDAKRYLCTVEPDYTRQLSAPSLLSMHLQGGLMSDGERREFASRQYLDEALLLRRCDDAAKVVGLDTPPLEHFLGYLTQLTAEVA